jgi:hypothetical protein
VRSDTRCGDFPSQAAFHKTEFMAWEEVTFQLPKESALMFEDLPLPLPKSYCSLFSSFFG